MEVMIYDNYGVLAHEKQHIYTVAPESTTAISEPFYIYIPSSLQPYMTVNGEAAFVWKGRSFLLSECLATAEDGMPIINLIYPNGEIGAFHPSTYGI